MPISWRRMNSRTCRMTDWTPQSWRRLPAEQQPAYPDAARLEAALERLAHLPPLVAPGAVELLQRLLGEAAQGQRFLLQGGDCAERFADCQAETIADKLKVLLQMSLVLTYGLRKPIVRVGRLAGQYAKPRSAPLETIEGVSLPVYRGDLVNDFAATPTARAADPERLLQAYFHAAATLNYVRALIEGGFADLHHPEHWDLAFIRRERAAPGLHGRSWAASWMRSASWKRVAAPSRPPWAGSISSPLTRRSSCRTKRP